MNLIGTIILVSFLVFPCVGGRAQVDRPPLPPTQHADVANLPVMEIAQTRMLVRFGQMEEALFSFDAMLARHPDWIPALTERAYLLQLLGRDTEASRDYARAQRLNPVAAQFYSARGSFSLLPFIALYPDEWFDGHFPRSGNVLGTGLETTLVTFQRRQAAQLDALTNIDGSIEFLRRKQRGENFALDEALSRSLEDQSLQWAALMRGNLALLRQDFQAAIQYFDQAELSGANWPELYYNRGLTSILLNNYATGCSDLQRSYSLGFTAGETMLRNLCTY